MKKSHKRLLYWSLPLLLIVIFFGYKFCFGKKTIESNTNVARKASTLSVTGIIASFHENQDGVTANGKIGRAHV